MFAGVKQWWANPFAQPISAPRFFLLVGLLLVILAIWKIITMELMEVTS